MILYIQIYIIYNFFQYLNVFNNREEVEKIYDECIEKYEETNISTNSLIYAYGILKELTEAEAVFYKLIREQKQISTEIFTSMLNCYHKCLKTDIAFELYADRYLYIDREDDMLIGSMINMCWVFKEAEKATGYWNKLNKKGFRINAKHYEGYLHALSTREDYAEDALELYTKILFHS